MTDIPHVLDALSIMVDELELEGRLAINLPEDYDWNRIDKMLGHLTMQELAVFLVENAKPAIKEYGAEAVYANEAFAVLRRKLRGSARQSKGDE
jgi:hypothetical protein